MSLCHVTDLLTNDIYGRINPIQVFMKAQSPPESVTDLGSISEHLQQLSSTASCFLTKYLKYLKRKYFLER